MIEEGSLFTMGLKFRLTPKPHWGGGGRGRDFTTYAGSIPASSYG